METNCRCHHAIAVATSASAAANLREYTFLLIRSEDGNYNENVHKHIIMKMSTNMHFVLTFMHVSELDSTILN